MYTSSFLLSLLFLLLALLLHSSRLMVVFLSLTLYCLSISLLSNLSLYFLLLISLSLSSSLSLSLLLSLTLPLSISPSLYLSISESHFMFYLHLSFASPVFSPTFTTPDLALICSVLIFSSRFVLIFFFHYISFCLSYCRDLTLTLNNWSDDSRIHSTATFSTVGIPLSHRPM